MQKQQVERVPVLFTWEQVEQLRRALQWCEEQEQLPKLELRRLRAALPVQHATRPTTKGDR